MTDPPPPAAHPPPPAPFITAKSLPRAVARRVLTLAPVASSDRAFRALAHAEPQTVLALVAACAPELLPPGATAAPVTAEDPNLEPLATPLQADWVARLNDGTVLHVECQGYRDPGFTERLLYYHLALALRYRPRPVHTVAIWLLAPPDAQRRAEIAVGPLRLTLTSLVVPELFAAELLRDARTVCFAAGADAGTWSEEQLCERVAEALRAAGASWVQRHMAVVAAALRGRYRYRAMVKAMERARMEPVIIEDLVRLGEDMGFEKGLEKGLEQGLEKGREEGREEGREKGREEGREEGREQGLAALRDGVAEILAARGFALGEAERQRLAAERSLEQLRLWLRRAATATAMEQVFAA